MYETLKCDSRTALMSIYIFLPRLLKSSGKDCVNGDLFPPPPVWHLGHICVDKFLNWSIC
jgi:hypothetical protein